MSRLCRRKSFNELLTVEQLTVGNLQLIGQPKGALAAKTSAALNIKNEGKFGVIQDTT